MEALFLHGLLPDSWGPPPPAPARQPPAQQAPPPRPLIPRLRAPVHPPARASPAARAMTPPAVPTRGRFEVEEEFLPVYVPRPSPGDSCSRASSAIPSSPLSPIAPVVAPRPPAPRRAAPRSAVPQLAVPRPAAPPAPNVVAPRPLAVHAALPVRPIPSRPIPSITANVRRAPPLYVPSRPPQPPGFGVSNRPVAGPSRPGLLYSEEVLNQKLLDEERQRHRPIPRLADRIPGYQGGWRGRSDIPPDTERRDRADRADRAESDERQRQQQREQQRCEQEERRERLRRDEEAQREQQARQQGERREQLRRQQDERREMLRREEIEGREAARREAQRREEEQAQAEAQTQTQAQERPEAEAQARARPEAEQAGEVQVQVQEVREAAQDLAMGHTDSSVPLAAAANLFTEASAETASARLMTDAIATFHAEEHGPRLAGGDTLRDGPSVASREAAAKKAKKKEREKKKKRERWTHIRFMRDRLLSEEARSVGDENREKNGEEVSDRTRRLRARRSRRASFSPILARHEDRLDTAVTPIASIGVQHDENDRQGAAHAASAVHDKAPDGIQGSLTDQHGLLRSPFTVPSHASVETSPTPSTPPPVISRKRIPSRPNRIFSLTASESSIVPSPAATPHPVSPDSSPTPSTPPPIVRPKVIRSRRKRIPSPSASESSLVPSAATNDPPVTRRRYEVSPDSDAPEASTSAARGTSITRDCAVSANTLNVPDTGPSATPSPPSAEDVTTPAGNTNGVESTGVLRSIGVQASPHAWPFPPLILVVTHKPAVAADQAVASLPVKASPPHSGVQSSSSSSSPSSQTPATVPRTNKKDRRRRRREDVDRPIELPAAKKVKVAHVPLESKEPRRRRRSNNPVRHISGDTSTPLQLPSDASSSAAADVSPGDPPALPVSSPPATQATDSDLASTRPSLSISLAAPDHRSSANVASSPAIGPPPSSSSKKRTRDSSGDSSQQSPVVSDPVAKKRKKSTSSPTEGASGRKRKPSSHQLQLSSTNSQHVLPPPTAAPVTVTAGPSSSFEDLAKALTVAAAATDSLAAALGSVPSAGRPEPKKRAVCQSAKSTQTRDVPQALPSSARATESITPTPTSLFGRSCTPGPGPSTQASRDARGSRESPDARDVHRHKSPEGRGGYDETANGTAWVNVDEFGCFFDPSEDEAAVDTTDRLARIKDSNGALSLGPSTSSPFPSPNLSMVPETPESRTSLSPPPSLVHPAPSLNEEDSRSAGTSNRVSHTVNARDVRAATGKGRGKGKSKSDDEAKSNSEVDRKSKGKGKAAAVSTQATASFSSSVDHPAVAAVPGPSRRATPSLASSCSSASTSQPSIARRGPTWKTQSSPPSSPLPEPGSCDAATTQSTHAPSVVEDEIDELDSSPPPEEKDDDDSPGSPTSVALAKGRKTTGRKKEPRPPVDPASPSLEQHQASPSLASADLEDDYRTPTPSRRPTSTQDPPSRLLFPPVPTSALAKVKQSDQLRRGPLHLTSSPVYYSSASTRSPVSACDTSDPFAHPSLPISHSARQPNIPDPSIPDSSSFEPILDLRFLIPSSVKTTEGKDRRGQILDVPMSEVLSLTSSALPPIGSHVTSRGSKTKVLERALSLESPDAMSFHIHCPRRMVRGPLRESDTQDLRRALEAAEQQVPNLRRHTFPHASNCHNLALPKPDVAVDDNSRRELKLWQQSMDALEHEMNTTVELGISHLVIHGGIGGSNDRESVRRRVASNLDDLLDRVPGLTLVLENLTCCRTQPAVVGSSIEELGAIRSLCRNRRRVKFCLDICHVHAMGSDLSTVPGVRRFQQRVIDVLGAENVVCMHISDCATPCGEKKHSHVAVGRGVIGDDSIRAIVRDPRFTHVGFVTETPPRCPDRKNIKLERIELRRCREELQYLRLIVALPDREWYAYRDEIRIDRERRWDNISQAYRTWWRSTMDGKAGMPIPRSPSVQVGPRTPIPGRKQRKTNRPQPPTPTPSTRVSPRTSRTASATSVPSPSIVLSPSPRPSPNPALAP